MDSDIIRASKPFLGEASSLIELIRAIEISKGKILLQPVEYQHCEGDYFIGYVYYGDTKLYPFYLKEKQLPEHIGIFGRTGAAKTNLTLWLIKALNENKKHFWIFDFKKEYRDLLQKKEFQDVNIYTVGRDDIAPVNVDLLSPPENASPDSYLNHLKNIIGEAYNCLDGAQDVIRDGLDYVYRDSGVFSNEIIKKPDFKAVYAHLALKKYPRFSREALWHDSALRALRSINYGGFGKSVNADENAVKPSDLLNNSIIWELDSLDLNSKIFFIESLLNWIYHYRLNNNVSSLLDLVIVVDESQNILSKERLKILSTVTKGHETIIEKFIREIRLMGIGLILVGHNISLFPIQVIGNLGTIFDLNTKHSDDVNEAAKSLLLKEKEYLGALQPGYAIVKMSHGWLKPFLIKTELFDIEKGKMRGIYGDSVIRKKMRGCSGYSRLNKAVSDNKSQFHTVLPYDINNDELAFLKSIAENPFIGIRERYKILSLSVGKGNNVQKCLIFKKFIYTLNLRTGQHAYTKFNVLTDEGRLIVKESSTECVCPQKEHFEHEYWKYTIAEKLKQKGWNVFIEWNNIDIMAEKDRKRIAVEIKTRTDGWKENLNNAKMHIKGSMYFLSPYKEILNYLNSANCKNYTVMFPWTMLNSF